MDLLISGISKHMSILFGGFYNKSNITKKGNQGYTLSIIF